MPIDPKKIKFPPDAKKAKGKIDPKTIMVPKGKDDAILPKLDPKKIKKA
jgi:hypothetical protein